MPENPANQTGPKAPETLAVEALREQLETDTSTFAGVRVREGWAVGALVTRDAYNKAVKRFLGGPTALENPAKDGE